jgi:hypothetical protein
MALPMYGAHIKKAIGSMLGTSAISQNNNNYFGEKFLRCNAQGQNCAPNTNPNGKAPWRGAVPCSTLSGSPNPGFACFSVSDLGESAAAALYSNHGRYLNVAESMQGASVGAIAQAIANAGWCTQGGCVGGGYGQQVQADYNELLPVLNSLFPGLNLH